MHFRQKLTFMAFGSILTLAGYLLATIASDVTAQLDLDDLKPIPAPEKKNATFDKIVCRELQVVDANGKVVVDISPLHTGSGGLIRVTNAESKASVRISTDSTGGNMGIYHADGKASVMISTNPAIGGMLIHNADRKTSVNISAYSTDGSNIRIVKDGKTAVKIGDRIVCRGLDVDDADGETGVWIKAISGTGLISVRGGLVSVRSHNTEGAIQLGVDEYGGKMSINGNDSKNRVLIGVNERGHGSINTWDKNGYRTRP